MLFNSYIFILLFLPAALLMYFGCLHFGKGSLAKITLIAMSLWFYAYFHAGYLVLILLSVAANYCFSRALLKAQKKVWKKGILTAGLLGNVGLIFYYKYFNFFLTNINALFQTSFVPKNIILPLGISFFTFQQISYLADSYRGETKGYGFLDYCLFVTFFPQLVAGPIVSHDEMMPQFQDPQKRKFGQEAFSRGLYWFSIGLFKKVLLADTLAGASKWGFDNPGALSAAGTFLLSLIYTLQLYFDFSGYCDMACGISSMFHIDLPINFNSPYKAVSIIDFWKRWHMSLTRFLRKYIYIPLGGSRKGTVRTYANIFVVFLISGIWHGANWTYVLWGCVHGIAQILNRMFGKIWGRLPRWFARIGTFLFVDMAWLIFRANSLSDCKILFTNMLTGKGGGIADDMVKCFDIIEFTYLEEHIPALERMAVLVPGINMWVVLGLSFLIVFCGRNCYEKTFQPTAANACACVLLLVWSVLSLSGLSVFLYFNF